MDFKNFRFVLSEGMWPRVGFELDQVVVVSKDFCRDSTEWRADKIYFPLRITSLFDGEIRFTNPRINALEVYPNAHPCKLPPKDVSTKSPPQKIIESKQTGWLTPQELKRVRRFVYDVWPKVLKDVQPWIHGLRIQQGRIFSGTVSANSDILELNQWKLDLKPQKRVAIAGDVQLPRSWTMDLQIQPISFSLMVNDDQLDLSWSGHDLEGRFWGQTKWTADQDNLKINLKMDHFPMRTLIDQLKEQDFPLQLHAVASWMSFDSDFDLPLLNKAQSKIFIPRWRWSGDFGEFRSENVTYTPWSSTVFQPFRLYVHNLKVQSMLNSVGREHLRGVMTPSGLIEATVFIENKNHISLSSSINGLEFYFVNQGRRYLQKVDNVKTDLQWDGQRIKGLIESLDVTGGEYKGKISFNMDSQLKNGPFQVEISKLKFHEDVGKLLFGDEMGPLEIYGNGWLSAGNIEQWQGLIGSQYVNSKTWSAKPVKAKVQITPNGVTADLKAEELNLKSANPFYGQLIQLTKKMSVKNEMNGRLDHGVLRLKKPANRNTPTILEWDFSSLVLNEQQMRAKGQWAPPHDFQGVAMTGRVAPAGGAGNIRSVSLDMKLKE